MPPRSKIAALPSEVKAWLDSALVEGNFSDYEALASELHTKGYDISKSAIHRYGQGFEDRLSALKVATEQARAVVDAAPDNEGAVNEALMRLVQEKLFQLLMAQEGHVDLPKVAKAIAELGKASVVQKKFRVDEQARIEREARDQLLAEQEEKLQELRGADGMSEQMEARIRRILLGKE